MIGLVLTAGGARGAYQAGVLKRIGEIKRFQNSACPFSIIAGASAGAINGAGIASQFYNFTQGTQLLAELWSKIQFQNVFKSDPFALGVRSVRLIQDLSFGGLFGGGAAQSLLDFSPLRGYLESNIKFENIKTAIEKGGLYALGISATSYYSGKSYTFIQGQPGHPLWAKSRRVSLPVTLDVDHIWASCAIPLIFQPVKVSLPTGDHYFGDGGLRLITPFSPAIRLGANRVFAIGIRSQKSAEARSKAELIENPEEKTPSKVRMRKPPLAQIFGVALNSIFLDHLDADLEHLVRMNQILTDFGAPSKAVVSTGEPMKIIQPFAINPSVDLAEVAQQFGNKMPTLVRYLMEGLGTSKSQSADLLSYLLFDSHYTTALIDIGYKDATEQIDPIEDFLCGD